MVLVGPQNRQKTSLLRLLRDKSAILPIKKGPVRGALLVSGGVRVSVSGAVRNYAKIREIYAKNHQPPVHDVSLVHCIVADSVTVVR